MAPPAPAENPTTPQLEDIETFVQVEGVGDAPLLRRQRSLPPKYDEVFPDAFNQNDDNTPSAPPVQFDLVPIRTGTQRQNSVTNNRQTMI